MAKARRASRTGKPVRSKPTLQPSSTTTEVGSAVVGLLTRTAVTALSGVRDVGAEVGAAAVTAVRGSVQAAGEIGADVGRLAAGAAEGAIEAADRIASAAGKAVGNLVNGTIEGVREIMQTPVSRRPAAVKPLQKVRRPAGGRAEGETLPRRKPLARRPSRTQRMGARPGRVQTGSTS
jgi:hypothetical protein